MTRSTFFLRCCGTAIVLVAMGCATVDPRPSLQNADATMERHSGVKTTWAQLPAPRELVPNADGVVALEDAISLALVNNRALRADLEIIGQMQAEVVQAGLLANPVLSLMTGFPEAGGRASIAFGLSKDFAELWLIPSRKRAAQATVRQRVLMAAKNAIDLIAEVTIAYRTLGYQALAVELEEKNLGVIRESMEIAQVRLRTGSSTQLDVNLIRARLVAAEVDLQQARADFQLTQRKLMRLMGVANATDAWMPTPLTMDEPPIPQWDENLMVEAALLHRLDVQTARWELESAMAALELERRKVMPMLGVGIGGERFERRATPDRDILADTVRATTAAGGELTAPDIQSSAERRQERRQEIDFILGPSFEIPLPIFDQNQAQIAKAHYRARELAERLAEAEQQATEGVRAALVTLKINAEKERIFRQSLVPIEESNLGLARSAYQAGKESISIILLAQETLNRTRLAQAGSMRDLEISLAELTREAGGKLPEAAMVVPGQP